MQLTPCTELLAADGLGLAEQAKVATALGSCGLDPAGTLDDAPPGTPPDRARGVRPIIEGHGLTVTDLPWPGLSVPDPARNDTTRGAPGTGDDPFPGIARAIREVDRCRSAGLEPLTTAIDATTTVAIAAATLRARSRAAETTGQEETSR